MNLPPKVKQGQPIYAKEYNALLDYVNSLRIVPSKDVLAQQIAGGTMLTIRPVPAQGRSAAVTSPPTPAIITSGMYLSGGQHVYTWQEAAETGASGYGTYDTKGGVTVTGTAYNLAECFVSGGLTRNFEPVPVETGAVVLLRQTSNGAYWFDRDVDSEYGDTPNGFKSLGSASLAVSGGLDSTTWNSTVDIGKGRDEVRVSGLYYNITTKKLMLKIRTERFDAGGRSVRVSSESEVEVIDFVLCT